MTRHLAPRLALQRSDARRCFRPAFALFVSLLLGISAVAQTAETRSFDIPSGSADKALKQFSEQSGIEVVFGTSAAAKVRTNTVKGELAPRAALEKMLEGTGLIVLTDKNTGALSVARDPNGPRAALGSGRPDRAASTERKTDRPAAEGPVAPASLATDTREESVIRLSPFQITEGAEEGYQSQQTMVGSRSAKNVLDIPANISIINSQQIEDLNAVEVSQVLAVGVSGVTRNQTINDDVNIRGFRTSTSLRNGVTKASFKRNPMFDVERVEVLKGPGALILGNNSFLGGAVNFVSRRASATPSGSVKMTFSEDNYARLAANITGPVIKSEDLKLNYRLTLGALTGDHKKEIEKRDDQKYLGGGLAFYFGEATTVFVNGYYFRDNGYFYWNDFLDISGPTPTITSLAIAKLNPNSTESYSVGRSKDAFWKNQDSFIDVTMLTKLTENGNLRLFYFGGNLVDRRRHIRGITMRADNYTLDRQDIPLAIDTITNNGQIDYLHHLKLSYLTLDSTVGVDGARTFNRSAQSVITMPTLDTRSQAFPNDDAYFAVPRPGTGGLPNLQDTGSTATSFSYYFQENVSLLKDRVILVGGLRWFSPGGTNMNYVTNVVTNRPDATFKTHKYGLIVKVLPSVSLYYTDAQNIFPQTGFTDRFAANDGLGAPLDNQQGKLKEYGLKFNHTFSPELSMYGSLVHFDMSLTNVRTFGDLGNGVQGIIQSLQDTGEGWEVDYGVRYGGERGHFDVVATYFDGDSGIAATRGVQAVDFVPRKYSLLAKYSWTTGSLKGLMVGGSYMDQTGKRNGNYLVEFPQLINLFAGYRMNRHWDFQLNLDNLKDKRYLVAVNATGLAQTAEGLQARLAVKYAW